MQEDAPVAARAHVLPRAASNLARMASVSGHARAPKSRNLRNASASSTAAASFSASTICRARSGVSTMPTHRPSKYSVRPSLRPTRQRPSAPTGAGWESAGSSELTPAVSRGRLPGPEAAAADCASSSWCRARARCSVSEALGLAPHVAHRSLRSGRMCPHSLQTFASSEGAASLGGGFSIAQATGASHAWSGLAHLAQLE